MDTNHTNDHVGDLVYDGVFEVLLSSGDPDVISAIQARWRRCGAA